MLDTEIKVYPNSIIGGFTVVHTDPFTKRKVRDNFAARKEAEAYKAALEKKFDQELRANPGEMLFSDLMMLFLKERSKNDLVRNKKLFVDFCDSFAPLKIKDVTTDALKIWFAQLQSENNYKETTMFGAKVAVNIFFRYLIEKGVISSSPVEGIHYNHRRPETRDIRLILTDEQIKDFVVKAKEYSPGYFYPIFLAFVETAAKTDEIIELKWDDVDFKKSTVAFPDRPMSKARTLPISEELSSCLSKKRPIADVVFTHLTDKKFRKRQLTIALFDFQEKYEIKKKWRFLDIRHSIAHNFLANGGDIRKLRDFLGHRSTQTTEELYGVYRAKRVEMGSPFEG